MSTTQQFFTAITGWQQAYTLHVMHHESRDKKLKQQVDQNLLAKRWIPVDAVVMTQALEGLATWLGINTSN